MTEDERATASNGPGGRTPGVAGTMPPDRANILTRTASWLRGGAWSGHDAGRTADPDIYSVVPDASSLELLLARVESEMATLTAHFDALDTKAGVLLGFVAVVIGITATSTKSGNWQADVFHAGTALLVVAAATAIAACFPRPLRVLQVDEVLRVFLAQPVEKARLALLRLTTTSVLEAKSQVDLKSRLMKRGLGLTGCALLLLLIGSL